jgi:hypothetical protein
MTCACGHDADEHRDRAYRGEVMTGRCDGQCVDTGHYGIYKCLCPYYLEEKL